MTKPLKTEYPDFYHRYVETTHDGKIPELMKNQLKGFSALLNKVSEEKENYSYAKGKWSVKEILGHIIDAERILSYRALCFARGEKNDIPQYDHDAYVDRAKFGGRSFEEMKKEFRFLRKANSILFESFDEDILSRTGTSGGKSFTVRALGFIIVGHVNHHMNVLKEKYL